MKIIVENEVDGIDYREACGKMHFQATRPHTYTASLVIQQENSGDEETDCTPGPTQLHCKKKVGNFPVPSRDVINQTLPGWE